MRQRFEVFGMLLILNGYALVKSILSWKYLEILILTFKDSCIL